MDQDHRSGARAFGAAALAALLLVALVAAFSGRGRWRGREPGPTAGQLLRAGQNGGEWLLPNKSYEGNRYTPAMIPVAFTGKVGGRSRELVAIGDKGENFLILDQGAGAIVHRLALSDQTGLYTTVPTLAGTTGCPNHGGGIEWNPGAYDPASNLFLVPSTEECGLWKLATDHPSYVPGQPYTGGPFPARRNGTGTLWR
jgi:hypothetical protein